MNSVEKSAHFAFAIVMVVLAAATGLASWRNGAVDPAVGLVFALLSTVMVMTAIWSLWRGPAALVQAASLMLVLHLVASFSLRSSATAQHWANARLYEALAVEGIFIWTALLAGGLWLAGRQRRARPA